MAGFVDPSRPARALYFCKAVVPWGPGPHYEHIGLYAYRREALEHFVGLPRGVLEQREHLEQLRALEAGMRISVSLIDAASARRAGRHPGRSRTRPRADGPSVKVDEVMPELSDPARTISFQGTSGAYSDLACRRVFPDMATLPCTQFEDAFAAVSEGRAALAMIADRELGRRPRRRYPPL